MNFELLNNDNLIFYAMRMYENPQCKNIQEFYEDMDRIKYIKRLLIKYKNGGELRERLLLNHIIVFYNIFNIEAATRILFTEIKPELHPFLKTFIVFLNNLPKI